MSTIIRATDQNLAIQQPAFNFEDMAVQAGRYLDGVRSEAAAILAAARKEAEAIRRRAESEGRQAGMNKVAQLAQERLEQRLQTLRPALEQVVSEIRLAKQAWLAQWEKGTVHLAAAIAGRILRRQLDCDPQIPLVLLREALELAAGSSHLRIHLNPSDHEALGPQAEKLVREMAPLATAEFVADAAVTAGGCRVETRLGSIDERLETQLARIEEELTGQ